MGNFFKKNVVKHIQKQGDRVKTINMSNNKGLRYYLVCLYVS